METVVLVLAILAAVLVMACGVWVAVVLIAAVARIKPTATPAPKNRATEKTGP
jgi:hypothetical protein